MLSDVVMVKPPGGRLLKIGMDHMSTAIRTSGQALVRTSRCNSEVGHERIVNSRSIVRTLIGVARSIRHRYWVNAIERLICSIRLKKLASSIDAVVEYVCGT